MSFAQMIFFSSIALVLSMASIAMLPANLFAASNAGAKANAKIVILGHRRATLCYATANAPRANASPARKGVAGARAAANSSGIDEHAVRGAGHAALRRGTGIGTAGRHDEGMGGQPSRPMAASSRIRGSDTASTATNSAFQFSTSPSISRFRFSPAAMNASTMSSGPPTAKAFPSCSASPTASA